MTMKVLVDELCRFFGTAHVLDQVSLTVAPGTMSALLGPNGAGKTTLLKLVMGLIEPSRGKITIGDQPMWPPSRTTPQIGCLIDGVEPPRSTRIRDIIQLSAAVALSFDHDRATRLLGERRLNGHQRWHTLSKGQKRFVLLAMLICRRCDVLLLDEPADGLDPESRMDLFQMLRRDCNQRGTTVLVTTHIINDIEKVADDVCILHRGQLILQDDLETLREQTFRLETEEHWEPPEGVQTLRMERKERFTFWLRDPNGKLPARVPHEIQRHHVSLEEIYLAVTKAASSTQAETALHHPV